MTESHSLAYGSAQIDFNLSWKPRKRLRIVVHPDLSIEVVAPEGKTLEDVLAAVRRRGSWVLRQLDYFQQFQPLPMPRQFVSGETHTYLGRQYVLRVLPERPEGVRLTGGRFEVRVADPTDTERVKRLLDRWLREHGSEILMRRYKRCVEIARRFGIPEPERVSLRRVEKRWGSCSRSGNVLLNTELVHAPVPCIDYVITHELCHLVHPNHGTGFVRLLTQCMPDWVRRRERLDQVLL